MATKMTTQAVVVGVDSITANFSGHERGVLLDPKDVSGNFIIDLDGNVLKGTGKASDVIITVIGGVNSHAHRKDSGERYQYYYNSLQKATLGMIGYHYGLLRRYDGQINMGNNLALYNDLLAAFENGRG